MKKRRGILIVLSSPSGGGKTTIYRAILERHPSYKYSVSATTRPMRNGEVDGIDYHFLTDEEFLRKIDAGEFVEWAFVHGYRYGTLKSTVNDALSSGEVLLFDLDVQGADAMQKAFPDDVVNIFILPPSREELRRRLTARKTDQPDVINLRLRNAENEVKKAVNYDYIVINDDLETAISQVDAIITAELCRPAMQLPIEGWNLK
ncbi:guanylate kinase [bacterium]|nr:guanylate kinase [bacterium]